MLKIEELVTGEFMRMAFISRYSSVPHLRDESVAEHSWTVSFYSMVIALDIRRRKCGNPDMSKLLSRTIVHDLDESLSGDLLRSFKYGYPELKRLMEEASKQALVPAIGKLGSTSTDFHEIFKHWEMAKENDLEGYIVQISDLLSVVAYCWRERAMGNVLISPVLKEVVMWLESKMQDLPQDSRDIFKPYYDGAANLARSALSGDFGINGYLGRESMQA